jgi:hypothetical protein
MGNPKPTTTPTTTRKGRKRLTSLNLHELNQVLAEIQGRLDQVDAIGHDPDMKGRKIINLGTAKNPKDALPLEQMRDPASMTFSWYWKEFMFSGGSGIG